MSESNEKFEKHTKKLSHDNLILSESKLELEKEIHLLKSKISLLENQQDTSSETFRKPSSLNRRSILPHHGISSDMHMEDEEGEMFNNTYLADMKSGKGPDFSGRDSLRFSKTINFFL